MTKKISEKTYDDFKNDITLIFKGVYPIGEGSSLTKKQDDLLSKVGSYIENCLEEYKKELFKK